MSWVKVDDKAWSHPKLTALSGNAVRLWLFAMCWCNQHETDGTIPRAALRALGGAKAAVEELLRSGLWEATESGWAVHDFLKYQPSREQREKERESGRQRAEHSYRSRVVSSPEESPKHARRNTESSVILHPTRTRPDPVPKEIPLTPSVLPPQGGGDRDISRGDLESFSLDIVIADGPEPQKAAKKPRKKPSTPFPDGLVPLPRQLEKCKELQLNCAEEFEKFSARHQSTGALFADWHRAFDTWISRAPEFRRPVGGAIVSRFQQPVSPNVDYETKQRLVAARRYAEFVGGAK